MTAAGIEAETSFAARADAIDFLDFEVIEGVEVLVRAGAPPAALLALRRRAEGARDRLAEIDAALFRRLREGIRVGDFRGATLAGLVDRYLPRGAGGARRTDEAGYDRLDDFVNDLLLTGPVPDAARPLEPEMVAYQRTPARVVFEMVERARFAADDVFVDLGSGLGHVPILVHLLGGVAARGVEIDPAYCAYARSCAEELALPDVRFVEADARAADLSEGTVFFLYTPFVGGVLRDVLGALRDASRRRPLTLFTYGPCTAEVAAQGWLRSADPGPPRVHALRRFRTV